MAFMCKVGFGECDGCGYCTKREVLYNAEE